MKHLNQTANAILQKLNEMMEQSPEKTSVKINKASGAFMAVHLEKRNDILGYGPVISLAHYYTQEGDLMSDPYMEFVKLKDNNYYPILFEQHGSLAMRQEALAYDDNGAVKGYRPSLQKDITAFANGWLVNIRRQQQISLRKETRLKLILIDEAKEKATIEIQEMTHEFSIQTDQDGSHYIIHNSKAIYLKTLIDKTTI